MNTDQEVATAPYYPKPYACKKCGKEFEKKQGWRMHMQRAHGELRGNPQLLGASTKRRYTKRPLKPYVKRPYVRRTKQTIEQPVISGWHFCPRCGLELRKEQS